MHLTPSDLYTLHRPSPCDLRIYLRHHGEEPSPPGPYDRLLRQLGQAHEKAHLAQLAESATVIDLSSGDIEDRILRTEEALSGRAPVIYQAVLRSATEIDGKSVEIIGEPDFLILSGDGYIVRDSKISRRILRGDHPEIFLQLGIYGWLLEEVTSRPPVRLEVHAGDNQIVAIPDDGGAAAYAELGRIALLKESEAEPFSPVGWSKCSACGFFERCWPLAEARQDVGIVPKVDQGLVRALGDDGVRSVDQLLEAFDEKRLSNFERPWGAGRRRVGAANAAAILRSARAISTGEPIVFGDPGIPDHPSYVMFDLEGLPPDEDALGKVFLWGLQVFGAEGGEFFAAVAGSGEEGDRAGWEEFLRLAGGIFQMHGDLPFVHWASYEVSRLHEYVDRFGDRDGIARRVEANLLDLLPATQNSVALPLASYSLKVIEKYVGFERSQAEGEYGGDWAMAKYIEAVETEDEALRQKNLEAIRVYNREDLEATWAVFEWLRSTTG